MSVESYSYHGWVWAINADNATNNNTMAEELERICDKEGYLFNASEGRLQCMPHTVHLAAIEASSYY